MKRFLNQIKNIDLEKGWFKLSANSSMTLQNAFFALSGDLFFFPYIIELRSMGANDNVLTKMNLTELDNGLLNGKNYFTKNELEILEERERETEKILINIKLRFPPKQESLHKIVGSQYNYLSDLCGLTVYTIFNTPSIIHDLDICNSQNIIQTIKKLIPFGSEINFLTDTVQINDFYALSGIDNYRKNAYSESFINVRGNSSYAFYIQGDLDLTISKIDLNSYKGSDDINVVIKNSDNGIIYRGNIEDDNDISNSRNRSIVISKNIRLNDLDGLYFIAFEEAQQITGAADYIIKKITINTNKFILLNGGVIFSPTDLFFEKKRQGFIKIYFSRNNPQDILVDDNDAQTIELTEDDNRKEKSIAFEIGRHKIQTTGSQIRIINNNFSFSKNGYFDFSHYRLGKEYVVIDNFEGFHFSLFELYSKYF